MIPTRDRVFLGRSPLLQFCILCAFLLVMYHICLITNVGHTSPQENEVYEKDDIKTRGPMNNFSLAQPVETLSYGVVARAFEPWNRSRPLPCYPPDDPRRSKQFVSLRTPTDKGFFFVKPMKTGGSTAAGLNLRIAKHTAKRQKRNFSFCRARWDHVWGPKLLSKYTPSDSFAWTVIREPTARAVSQFFHFEVSRENKSASDEVFQRYLKRESKTLYHYYLRFLSPWQVFPDKEEAPIAINHILKTYNFIGVTERMDESAVTLMMLLGISMADILHLNAKGTGGYDDGQHRQTCYYIQPSHVSKGMEQFFGGRQWQATTQWDRLLYSAANRSLDLTIDRLGRQSFESKLAKFRHAQRVARRRCLPREVFPCTSTGQRNKRRTCLWSDSACGNDCLDEVATELNLWSQR